MGNQPFERVLRARVPLARRLAGGLLPRPAPPPGAVAPGAAHTAVAERLRRARRCGRRHWCGRGARQRRRSAGAAARGYGRAAGARGDRAAVRQYVTATDVDGGRVAGDAPLAVTTCTCLVGAAQLTIHARDRAAHRFEMQQCPPAAGRRRREPAGSSIGSDSARSRDAARPSMSTAKPECRNQGR
jgi:hypothetical protein